MFGIMLLAVETVEGNGLIAQDAGGPIGGSRIQTPRVEIGFGSCDEEGARLM